MLERQLEGLQEALVNRDAALGVVGLGYVGRPLAMRLARFFRVIGYDADPDRIADVTACCRDDADAEALDLSPTTDSARLRDASLFIVCVPTPIDGDRQPDLTALLAASQTIGEHLKVGSVVVYESTVYPGCTEEDCVPVLESASGLRCGQDFSIGYSPERINPGDAVHGVEAVVKVVAGGDPATCELLAAIYGTAIPAGVYRAPSIKVAEASKVVENTQRDLNIALINEVALICHHLGVDTREVLETAATKWNFLPFQPGLVGGHCIGVDPYYLTQRAREAGYEAGLVMAGLRLHDRMGPWVAGECLRLLAEAGRGGAGARVLVLGVAYKENCDDCRQSRVVDLVRVLKAAGCEVLVCDPVVDQAALKRAYGLDLHELDALEDVDACVLAVAHDCFRAMSLVSLRDKMRGAAPPLLDVKAVLNRQEAAALGFTLWRL